MTEWKQIGTTDICVYEISNIGDIRSCKKTTSKITYLKHWNDSGGYKMVNIMKKKLKIHILVALHFIGERPIGYHIDHIDRDRQNNNVSNLRYVTPKENACNTSRYRDDILETNSKARTKIINKEAEDRLKSIIIRCECGFLTTKLGITKHLKSKVHKDRLNNKHLYFFCECGNVVRNYPSKIERHYKSDKHLKCIPLHIGR